MTSREDVTGADDGDLDEVVAGAVRGLFGRDAVYTIVWAVQLLGAALVTPVVTRLLDLPAFGQVAAAMAIMQVLFVLGGLGLYPAIQRAYAHNGVTAARRLLTLSLVGAGTVTAIAYVTGPLWAPHLGFAGYPEAVRVAVLWAGVSAVTDCALAFLRSQDRLVAFGSVSFVQSIVAEVTSLLLVHAVRPTAAMFLLGQLAVQVVAAALALMLVRPKGLRRADRPLLVSALGFGLPLVPAVLCTFVMTSADRLVVHGLLGSEAVARYQVASNIGSMPILLVGVLNSSWMPRIFSFTGKRERAAVLAAGRDVLLRLLVPVVVGLSVAAPIVLRIWAPASYRPDDLLFLNAVVVVGVVPYTLGLSSTRALTAEGRTGIVAAAQGAAAVVNVLLNLALIPRFGLVGSAAATVLAYVVLHRLLLTRARGLVAARPPGRLLLAVALSAAVALAASTAPSAGVALLVRGAIGALMLVWFTGILLSAARHPGSAAGTP